MGTVNRLIQSEHDRHMAAKFVENRPYPFTLTVTDGAPRSKAQNRLMNMWYSEVSQQKGDTTPQEVRAYCKLTIGVPILRSQNEAFKERYDEILKPLSYEQKLAIMSEPLNLPVTSLMNTKQLTDYLEAIIRHFGEQGIILTMPEDMKSNSGGPQPDAADAPPPASAASEEAGNPDPVSSPNSNSEASIPVEASDTAGDPPPSPSGSPATETEREILIRFARDVLPMAADTTISPSAAKAVEKEWAAQIKELSPDGIAQARTISESMRMISNSPAKLGGVLEHYAHVLETTVEELGG